MKIFLNAIAFMNVLFLSGCGVFLIEIDDTPDWFGTFVVVGVMVVVILIVIRLLMSLFD